MTSLRYLLSGLMLIVTVASVHAADVAGAKDHPLVSRYTGSEILKYQAKEFDRYVVPTGPSESSHQGPTSSQAYEGRITRLQFQSPSKSGGGFVPQVAMSPCVERCGDMPCEAGVCQ